MINKVVCYNNNGFPKELTLFKKYEIILTFAGYYMVKNDLGKVQEYTMNRFISIQEWRDKKLKEIGI
jgi:hypothetical protein